MNTQQIIDAYEEQMIDSPEGQLLAAIHSEMTSAWQDARLEGRRDGNR